jgi:phosphatidylinositol alpha-1,6-mannosyltransferase
MRILVLATDAFGGYGGIAQYNRDFIEALSLSPQVQQTDVMVRLGTSEGAALPPKVKQHPAIHSRTGYALKSIAVALQNRPDVIINAHLYHGPLARTLRRLTRARIISQLHGTEVWGPIAQKHIAPLEMSTAVLCVSRDTRARILGKASIQNERAIVVSNTVGTTFTPGKRDEARKQLGLTNETMILTVARLDAREGYKGHDRIIEALPRLKTTLPQRIVYWIVGAGEDRQRLEAMVQSFGLEDDVKFLGKAPADMLPDLYRAADLFALPSTGEGFGIAFIEAMACGTPAIGVAVGGAPDALGDGELGWCVEPAAFESALASALTTPRGDEQDLFQRVDARFGKQAFNRSVALVMQRITSDDSRLAS